MVRGGLEIRATAGRIIRIPEVSNASEASGDFFFRVIERYPFQKWRARWDVNGEVGITNPSGFLVFGRLSKPQSYASSR
jgi:hypothetical protein